MINSVNKRDFHFRDYTTNTNNSKNHDRLSSVAMSTNNLDHPHLVGTLCNNTLPFCNSSTNLAGVLKSQNIKTHKTNANDEHSHVQCLQTSTLNKTEWNPRMLLNLSAEIKNETPEESINIIRDNVQSDSAFINDNLKSNITVYALGDSHILRCASTQINGTENQGRALFRIEDVHNYAKLSEYSYSNESSESSLHEGESEIDDADDADDADDTVDFTVNKTFCKIHSEDKFNNNNINVISKIQTCTSKDNRKCSQDNDYYATSYNEQDHFGKDSIKITPDHHARRPMNAFLIFCKRHRAIVKAKYKSLENRAITKILGDWWASLDSNDKKSFTDLAEQNKAAFFSANPNFKWYKLPAPSLRTLSTRPNNNDLAEDQKIQAGRQHSKNYQTDNYFKLADVTQMGELNTLICDKNTAIENQLQQVLGETTEFLSAHIPISLLKAQDNNCTAGVKRRLYSENILSKNNGHEHEIIIKNTGRSCKGKIYQELKKSGQITVITKKIKSSKGQCVNDVDSTFLDNCQQTFEASTKSFNENDHIHSKVLNTVLNNKRRVVSESDSHAYEVIAFDLEEKIKKLPALCLDAYLQRKRSIKKKKKFSTTKKRNSNNGKNVSIPLLQTAQSLSLAPQVATAAAAAVVAAVGSQKRKARKESITRRNVNAMESGAASILPTVDCYTNVNDSYNLNESTLTSPEIPITNAEANKLQPNFNCERICSDLTRLSSFNEHILSTSNPLGLLAEVAANRTELNNL